MKLEPFTLLATVGLALTQVSATPIRIGIISSTNHALSDPRFGLPAAHVNTNVTQFIRPAAIPGLQPATKKKGCGMRTKAVRVSNWIRLKLGMPAIKPTPTEGHPATIVAVMPHYFIGAPPAVDNRMLVHPTPMNHHFYHQRRSENFLGRVHKALMALGPWEGRVVAFVLGCGIGSLLRMIWVLLIITFRPRKSEAQSEPVYLCVEDISDEPHPPKYSDEKVVDSQNTA